MDQHDRRREKTGGLKAPYAPVVLQDVDVAFPARALEIMPSMSDIPERFRRDSPWHDLLHDVMFGDVKGEELGYDLKEGIDGETAVRHIFAIMGSYAPKHEHKLAAFAFLCDQWFEAVLGPQYIYSTTARTPREND